MHRALAEFLIHTERPSQNITYIGTISHFKLGVLKTCLLAPAYSKLKRTNACMEHYVCAHPLVSCMYISMYTCIYIHTSETVLHSILYYV